MDSIDLHCRRSASINHIYLQRSVALQLTVSVKTGPERNTLSISQSKRPILIVLLLYALIAERTPGFKNVLQSTNSHAGASQGPGRMCGNGLAGTWMPKN